MVVNPGYNEGGVWFISDRFVLYVWWLGGYFDLICIP